MPARVEADHGQGAMTEHDNSHVWADERVVRILDAVRVLARPVKLDAMLDEVLDVAKELLDAESGSVWRYLEASHELEARFAPGAPPVRISADRGLAGECLRTRKVINVPDCYAEARFDRSVDLDSGHRTRCMLSLPLIDQDGAIIGVLQVLNRRHGVFGPEDEQLAGVFAAQCAVALHRAQLTERLVQSERVRREIEVARLVQMSTLPKTPPAIAGYDIAGAFRPADETGGDTYDFVPTPDGCVMVLMGDATGHGIGPALSATQVRAMLRVAQRLGAGLDDTFRHINDQLVADLPEDRFVTAFLGLLDPHRHTLSYHSGGQGPLLHFHAATRRVDTHPPTTAPLGAMEQTALRPPRTLALAPGDVFALLSDGVYEYNDGAGNEFGESAVTALLSRHHTGSMAHLRDLLLDALRRFGNGTAQQDDISIVLIRRLAVPGDAPSDSTRQAFPRRFEALDGIFAFLHAALDANGVAASDAYAVTLAAEELFTNMVKYNPAGGGRILIEIECPQEQVTCRLTDPDSERFDVTRTPDVDTGAPLEHRRPGGLGLHLVRRLVDTLDYEYANRRSVIVFRKARSAPPLPESQPADAPTGEGGRQALPYSPGVSDGKAAMFEIGYGAGGAIALIGRFDAAQCGKAEQFISAANAPSVFDFARLEYISSAGLGVLLKAHKRLLASGARLHLVNVNSHIYDIFRFSGFDQVFEVERQQT
ncbi:MAG: SpoIIE family protein phosphatase [Proteobacteria bacterium]|nr:SpoIIE family protein phosphatase [Pseudomonadota bacterium]